MMTETPDPMVRRRMSREDSKAQTRAEILRAAREVIARRGLNSASIDEIAEQAGFSHGAVYSNFSSKEELMMAVYEEFIQMRASDIAEPLEQSGFIAGSRQAADQWMRVIEADPDGYVLRLEFALQALRDPQLKDRFARQLASNRHLLGRLIAERAESKSLDPQITADELATIVRALGIGLAMEKLVNPQDIPQGLYADAVAWILECAGLGDV